MASRSKVLHVCTIGMTAVKLLRPQVEYLREQGYEVGFVFSPDAKARQELTNAGFGVEEISISRSISPSDIVSIIRLASYFRRVRPDIVHTHTSKAGIVGRVAARLAGVPRVIHTVHGFPFAEGQNPVKYAVYAGLERWAGGLADILLSQSEEDVSTARRLKIRSRRGFPEHIGNGVDLERFNPHRFDGRREEIRGELGLGPEPVIGIVARQTFEKGYAELVNALGFLADVRWSAIFIGEDEGAGGWIRENLAQKGLLERVRLLGARSDVDRLLAVVDVYVLPSYREGLPRSVIEAQAMGIPAVVTDIRGCREVVEEGVTGYLVPARDQEALAAALRKMIQDPGKREIMGAAARRRAETFFDERQVFQRIAVAYETLNTSRTQKGHKGSETGRVSG